MALAPGARARPYEIVAPLGAGGLLLIDVPHQTARPLLALDPDSAAMPVPSLDERWIYFTRTQIDADIWLAELK